MSRTPLTLKKLTCTLLAACTAALIVAGSSGIARAQEDDDEDVPYDTKILRGVMSTLGFKRDGEGPGIDYRERSPLVVPPSLNLPPPEAAAPAPNVANWPSDPDEKRRKEAIAARKKAKMTRYQVEDEGRALSQKELTPGAGTVDGRNHPAPQSGRGDGKGGEPGDRLSAFDLGYKGDLFSLKTLFGDNKEEVAKFEREPPRNNLTEPPVGYRTPSPAQPYGINSDKKAPSKPMDIFDRQTPVDGR